MTVLPINITERDRIIIIAPHPDDECIGAGGLLSLYPELCDVIVLTDGRYGQKNVVPEEEKEIRKKEFVNEMEYVQVHSYRMLDFKDGELMAHLDCMHDIDFSVYTKLFVSNIYDDHPDHTACFYGVLQRIKEQNIKGIEVYQYEVHIPLQTVTHRMDITPVIEEKIKLINFHKSQISGMRWDLLSAALAKYRACQCNLSEKYMETYLKIDILRETIEEKNAQREKDLQKYEQYYRLLIKWMNLKQTRKKICEYLKAKGFYRITIYGFSDIGQLLYKELEYSEIEVKNILDKRNLQEQNNKKIVFPDEGDIDVDVVLVTPLFDYDNICAELQLLGYKKILSLQSVVEDMDGKCM